MALDSHSQTPSGSRRAVLQTYVHNVIERAQSSVASFSGWLGERATTVAASAIGREAERVWLRLRRVGRWLSSSRVSLFMTASLARRIIVGNLVGLLILLVGMLLLNQHQRWLIASKQDSLRVQGEIIAAAIAASAGVDSDRLTFDPDKLPEVEGARLPYRDDAFAALELSLRPDRVGPVLRRLIQSAHNTRARIYGREGELLVDTHRPTGSVHKPTEEPSERIRVKTPWTRLMAYFDASDLQVYHEIGSANGNYYPEVRKALKGEAPPPALLLNERNKQIVALAVPILRRNSTLGALMLSTRPGEIDDVLAKERRILFSLGALALVTTIITSLLLHQTISDPMRRLSAAAEQVSQSINARADLPDLSDRRDEIGQMGAAFKKMTAALYRRIEASEKFAADVAHELKNPLTAARATAETMAYAKTDAQREQLVSQIQGELKRLNKLITDVSNASRLEAELARQTTEPVDVGAVLTQLTHVFQDLSASDGITITLDVADRGGSDPLVIKGHEGRIGQVVTNLVDNAISFSKAGQTVSVSARRVDGEVEIVVEDQGPGMPGDKLEAIFDRFYSDRPESDRTRGKNSGLGLSISREIVAAHEGRIWAENKTAPSATPDGEDVVTGARFVVRLPSGTSEAGRGSPGTSRRFVS